MTLRPLLLPLRLLLLLLISGAVCRAEAEVETESPVRTLQVETLVQPPESCTESAAFGDTLHIHYTGSLADGRIIDTSLTRDPLVIELGQKQVIPGLEQSLLDMCVGEKRRAVIPSHLAYGKRGYPPSIPADAVVQYDVELIALIRANYWQKLLKGILPLVGVAMVPALLGLIGYHLYKKASTPRVSKKKLKERERKREKEKGKEEKRRDRPGAPSPRPPAEKDPLGRARGRDPRAARPTVGAPAGRTDHRDTSPVHTPAWPRPGGWGKRSAASAERGRAEPRAPLGGRKSGRGHAVVGRRRKDTYAVAGEAFPHTPPDARARAGAGGCGRASGARPHPRETNPCVEG